MMSPQRAGGGRGVQRMAIWGDFQGLTGVTGGGRGVKKLENWDDVIYGWSVTFRRNS